MGTTEHEYIKLTSNRILCFYQMLHQAAYFHLSAAPLTVYV